MNEDLHDEEGHNEFVKEEEMHEEEEEHDDREDEASSNADNEEDEEIDDNGYRRSVIELANDSSAVENVAARQQPQWVFHVLEENNPRIFLPHIIVIYDDECARLLGQALAKNYSRKIFSLSLGDKLSVQGAQFVLDGLKNSQITALSITDDDTWSFDTNRSACVRYFVEGALQIMHELSLELMMNDELAETIGTTLMRGNNTKVQKLTIQIGMILTEIGAHQLADAFTHCNLQKLMLSDDGVIDLFGIMELSSRKALQILFCQAVKHVQELFVYFSLDNEDIIALSEVLEGNTSLQHLVIRVGNDLSSSNALRLAKQILLSHIVHIDLNDLLKATLLPKVGKTNDTDKVYASQTIPELEPLALSLSGLGSSEMKQNAGHQIPELIMNNISSSQLTGLRFQQGLKYGDLIHLCEALPFLTSLITLSVSKSLTRREGDALSQEDSRDEVQYSDLEGMNVQAAAAERLMIAVASHPAIVELNLESSDIGHMGLDMIGQHLPNVKLKKLKLDVDPFDRYYETNDDALRKAQHRACETLVAGVRSNVYLRELHILLPSIYSDEIDFYLELNKIGRHRLQAEDGVDSAEMCHLLANCGYNVAAIYYFLREQPQLVLLAADDLEN
jgi:hypothetical protein